MTKEIRELDDVAIMRIALRVRDTLIKKHGIARVLMFQSQNKDIVGEFTRLTWICIREEMER